MQAAGDGDRGAAPVEVRVYKEGRLIDSTVCESEAEASALIVHWSDVDDVEFEVDDLSSPHHTGEILEPEAPTTVDVDETAPRN
jgi:hypothetical protein